MYFLKCLFLSPGASGTVLYSLKCFCVTLSTCQNNFTDKACTEGPAAHV
uniref:Uncharacterized protein n=1 Tax=Anguilla anguilla TaxID=7936 RepID=A0A0E9TR55_ANGAN